MNNVAAIQGRVVRVAQHSLCAELSLVDGNNLIEGHDHGWFGGEPLEGTEILVNEKTDLVENEVALDDVVVLV